MTISIERLLTHHGPNIYGPQPGVALQIGCDHDCKTALKNALKDGAQFIGLILAYLEVESRAGDQGWQIEAHFTTPDPDLGAELARYVVAGIQATADADESWDRDTPLFELQKRRRREAFPLATLQLVAEARRRGVPVLVRDDGCLQFGYGKHSQAFDPYAPAPTPAWETMGDIELYVVTGEDRRDQIATQIGAGLAEQGRSADVLLNADWVSSRRLLARRDLECAVLSLQSSELLHYGLPFECCTRAVISDCDGRRPAAARDEEEWLRALGLPMLVSRQPALLNMTDPRIAALADFAPHGSLSLVQLQEALRQPG
jgi:hypothetical protein